jgi:asparagine synthase (glutamine-hydrolysing)
MLAHLNGMFALALLDTDRRSLLLARDRAGEKPLFVRAVPGELRFASELKALLADASLPRRVAPAALDCYLAMGYVPGALCMLDGFSKLPAGHLGVFSLDDGSWQVRPYWAPPPLAEAPPGASDAQLVDELESLLQAAVKRQLQADVPVALLLSGGVDSSLITALAARSASRVKTFTVGFRQHARYDESSHAGLIASHFGTEHTLLQADDVSPAILGELVRQYDEPMVDSSMIPTCLVSRQITRHCKVALGGDGGDELFGGYHSASRMAWLASRAALVPQPLRRGLARLSSRWLPAGARGRTFLDQWQADPQRDLPMFAGLFDAPLRRRLMRRHAGWQLQAESIRSGRVPQVGDAVQRVTRYDFANYMAEDILVKVDRASMLNSLEIRAPFLDRDVVEFAFGRVPSRLKAGPTERKRILRLLAARLLPPQFDQQRKQGFGIPIDAWLRSGPWRTLFQQLLGDPGCLFDRQEVGTLFRSLDAGRPVKEHLFGLATFEMWRREYDVAI